MKKTVILSTNDNPDYANYLPYAQEAWNKLGWDTLTFVLGDTGFISQPRNEIIQLTDSGQWRPETAVQVIRLFAHQFINDGIIMTGDADMIPLANYWQPTPDHITVYGYDLTGRSQYPICYIAMTAEKWRRIIPETSLDELLLQYPNAKSDDFYKWWGVDQEIITERINQRKGPDELVMIDRGFDGGLARGRVDRYDWEGTIARPGQKIDAHMLRPFNLEQTERVMKMITP